MRGVLWESPETHAEGTPVGGVVLTKITLDTTVETQEMPMERIFIIRRPGGLRTPFFHGPIRYGYLTMA